MHVLSFVAENFKKLRIVEITPKGRLIQITGKNGQDKTSALDALWAALAGKRATPDKPVRKGANSSRLTMYLGDAKTGKREIGLRRIINGDRTTTIQLENSDGTKYSSPQAMLDDLMGELTFDPLEFIHMTPKAQVETLRKVVKIEEDVEALDAANKTDYDRRTEINREVARLEAEIGGMVVQENLPKSKIDDAALMQQISEVGERNKTIEETRAAKSRLGYQRTEAERMVQSQKDSIERAGAEIDRLAKELAEKQEQFKVLIAGRTTLEEKLEAATAAFQVAPEPEYLDTAKLTAELQQAQATNREIDRKTRRDEIKTKLDAKRKESTEITRAMERRTEKKRAAIANAKMPVEGLTFSDESDAAVLYNGIPLEQMGEGEQIKISAQIAMAANPKLRILRIMHGEALDDDGLAILAQLAEEHDYQIWMARVETSGKVGIVLEDGEVKTDN